MRKPVVATVAAVILVAVAVVPVVAAPFHALKPTLETTACLVGDQMHVRSDWFNEDPAPTGGVTATWTFKGPGHPASPAAIFFVGPTLADSYVQFDLNKFLGDSGLVAWNDWSSIGTSITGAFTDKARSIRQPSGGWATCA